MTPTTGEAADDLFTDPRIGKSSQVSAASDLMGSRPSQPQTT